MAPSLPSAVPHAPSVREGKPAVHPATVSNEMLRFRLFEVTVSHPNRVVHKTPRPYAASQAEAAVLQTPPVGPDREDLLAALRELTTFGLLGPAPSSDDDPATHPT